MKKMLQNSMVGLLIIGVLTACGHKDTEILGQSSGYTTSTSTPSVSAPPATPSVSILPSSPTPTISTTSAPSTGVNKASDPQKEKIETELSKDTTIKFLTWSPDNTQVLYVRMKYPKMGSAYIRRISEGQETLIQKDIQQPYGFMWNKQGNHFMMLEQFDTTNLRVKEKVTAWIYQASDLKALNGVGGVPTPLWDETGTKIITAGDQNDKKNFWCSIIVVTFTSSGKLENKELLRSPNNSSIYYTLKKIEKGIVYYTEHNDETKQKTEGTVAVKG